MSPTAMIASHPTRAMGWRDLQQTDNIPRYSQCSYISHSAMHPSWAPAGLYASSVSQKTHVEV